MAAEEVPDVSAYADLEPPEILSHNLRVGARLLAAAQAFSLLAFVFAYLYLRALNSNGDWRPKHVDPSVGLGVALAICLAAFALSYSYGVRRLGDGTERGWRVAALATFVLGLGAFGLIVAQFAAIQFGPTSGGYASVFVGWLAFYGLNLVLVLGWLEMLIAQSLRTETQQVVPEASDVAAPFEVMRPAGDALGVVLYLVAGFGLLAFLLLWVL
jgi:heme/copper-type cytochrome/quinol oxidase subunit 3